MSLPKTDLKADVVDATEYLRDDDGCAATRALLEGESFAVEALIFAAVINGYDDVRYGMFVTPDKTVHEFEHDLYKKTMRIWKTEDLSEAAVQVPELPAALEMAEQAAMA